MKRFFNRLAKSFSAGRRSLSSPKRDQRVRPRFEVLEDRQMLSVTDMTGVAQLFPRHAGPTMLYLNFDGYTANGVSSFQSTTGNRNQDIQAILYRTSEIFAPFDVEVRRIYGNGNYDSSSNGNSTIFIGDNTNNGTGASNGAYAGTPWVYADFPGDVHGIHHQPNSDAFDLAYIDPVYGTALSSWSNTQISRAIGHEAGHTFGLAHVLSSPNPEMMSYDASNTCFINQTFNITDLNNNGTTTASDPGHAPKWYQTVDFGWFRYDFPVTITTQNSYTFLQTVLGARSTAGDLANVADATAVDGSYVDGGIWNAGPGFNLTAYVQRAGDYDVYNLSTSTSRQVAIDVKQIAGSTLDPVLFVYNSSGQTLLAFNDDSGGTLNSRLIFSTTAGQTYKIVVGSYGSNSTGGYQLTVNNYYPWVVSTPVAVAVFSPISGPIESPLLTAPLAGSSGAGAGMGGVSTSAMDRVFAQTASAGSPNLLLPSVLSTAESRAIAQVLSSQHGSSPPALALYPHGDGLPGGDMDLPW